MRLRARATHLRADATRRKNPRPKARGVAALLGMISALGLALPATAGARAPVLSLVSLSPGNIRVHAGGELAIGLLCHPHRGPCQGRVTLRLAHAARGNPLASAKLRLVPGRTTAVTLTLSHTARKLLGKRHRLRVEILAQTRDRHRRAARLSASRTLVPGAPVGCWPKLVPGYDSRGPSSRTARVFTYIPHPGGVGSARTYGCLYRLDHAFPLDDPGKGDDLMVYGSVVFDGSYVASVVMGSMGQSGSLGEPFFDVASFDLQNGRRVHLDRLGSGGKLDVSLVVSTTGAIARIYGDGVTDQTTTVAADDAGGYRELDSGTGIRTFSLRLSGTTVSWTHNGQTRTAQLR